ncbi:MAG: CBS domain-containing protein, partial [Gammaproteobacteria bacterium]
IAGTRSIVAGNVLDESEEERRVHDSQISLSSVMTETLDLVAPGAGLRDTALLMRNHRHGCLPVLADDQLVGIITDTDFVEVSIHLLEQLEAEDLFEESDPD